MLKQSFLWGLALLFLTLARADAAILYGHSDNGSTGTGNLYRIDTASQDTTLVGGVAGRFGPEIEVAEDFSVIYMSAFDPGFAEIDQSDGSTISSVAFSNFPRNSTDTEDTNIATGMGFANGVLYGAFSESGDFNASVLGTIDTTTGAITEIGAMTGMGRPTGGMHFIDGVMYAVSSTNVQSRLYTINLVTGAATELAALVFADDYAAGNQGDAVTGITGITYEDDRLYAVRKVQGSATDTMLYSIDFESPAGSGLGNVFEEFDLDVQLSSLTVGVVPEPGSMAIWSLAGLSAFILHRRRRRAA